MEYPEGSIWRKWDLHVHTPASLVQNYGGDREEIWEKFFQDIESLPPEFKVLGINDYLFIDGYRKVLEAKQKGRLQNIDLLLPVIEFRLDKFGGSESRLSRVNYHVIFSNEVEPDTIEHNFLNTLSTSFLLTPGYEEAYKKWNSNITRKSLEELGQLIIETTPEDTKNSNMTPLHRGFSNINFKLEDIQGKLSFHHFQNKHLTAVGKTEWADIKWNYQVAAEKKHVINGTHMVFSSLETPDGWSKARQSLQDSGVNNHLLDCSDAHFFSDAEYKDSLGKCYTWIKADPTFAGLRHALKEFDERIFVGEEPEKTKVVRTNGTKYVDSLNISKLSDSELEESWFDDELKFNTGLVAIIGNKGSGKSALADILGLLGNTKQHRGFSFLNNEKFRQPKNNKAQHFEANLLLRSGKAIVKKLDEPVDDHETETIKYIPQSFLERICNEVATGNDTEFNSELEAVIFSHVGEADRLGMGSLTELIAYRTQETYESIDNLKTELRDINQEIIRLEEQLTPEYRKRLENRLKTKEDELGAHAKLKPSEVQEPENNPQAKEQAATTNEELEEAELDYQMWKKLIEFEEEHQKYTARSLSELDKARGKVDNLIHSYEQLLWNWPDEVKSLGLQVEDVISFQVDLIKLETETQLFSWLKSETNVQLDEAEPESLVHRRIQAEQQIDGLRAKLDQPNKEYQDYLAEVEKWEAQRKTILGTEDVSGSLEYLRKELLSLDKVPGQLEESRKQREEKIRKIYSEIVKLADVYKDLYKPVQKFIEHHHLAKDEFDLNFEVSIIDTGFGNRFFDHINRNISGSFCGRAESSERLETLLEHHDFNSEDSTIAFLNEIAELLTYDKRLDNPRAVEVSEQLRKGYSVESLYDFVFSLDYLRPHYTLKMGNKELHQLSPGERGSLLLIFYLLVDKGNIPLILDQPEENLDNQTISGLLAPCIKEAKKRRQVFIVTHNPNIAVVCDAEQVIHASMDKKGANRIAYTCGAIESSSINPIVVDILEGTRPAFDNRGSKYWAN